MAEGLQPSDLTTIVPLLLLLVVEFSSLARDTGNELDELAKSEPAVNLFTRPKKCKKRRLTSKLSRYWPNLGRLNIIHFTNVVVLYTGFILVLNVDPSPFKTSIALIISIVWLQLPLLEIDEYSMIRKADIAPYSLVIHVISTVPIVGMTLILPYDTKGFLRLGGWFWEGNSPPPIEASQVLSLLGIIVISIAVIAWFLKRLETELEQVIESGKVEIK
jgi:hypothetical protein